MGSSEGGGATHDQDAASRRLTTQTLLRAVLLSMGGIAPHGKATRGALARRVQTTDKKGRDNYKVRVEQPNHL